MADDGDNGVIDDVNDDVIDDGNDNDVNYVDYEDKDTSAWKYGW